MGRIWKDMPTVNARDCGARAGTSAAACDGCGSTGFAYAAGGGGWRTRFLYVVARELGGTCEQCTVNGVGEDGS